MKDKTTEEETKKPFDPVNSEEGSLYLLALGYQGLLKWKENIEREKLKSIRRDEE